MKHLSKKESTVEWEKYILLFSLILIAIYLIYFLNTNNMGLVYDSLDNYHFSVQINNYLRTYDFSIIEQLSIDMVKPPFFHIMLSLLWFLFYPSHNIAILVNFLYLSLSVYLLYSFCKNYLPSLHSLFITLFFIGNPVTISFLTRLEIDFILIPLLLMFAYIMHRDLHNPNYKQKLALLLIFVIGIFTKQSIVLYFSLPSIYYLFQQLKSTKLSLFQKRVFMLIPISLVIIILISFKIPWYHFPQIMAVPLLINQMMQDPISLYNYSLNPILLGIFIFNIALLIKRKQFLLLSFILPIFYSLISYHFLLKYFLPFIPFLMIVLFIHTKEHNLLLILTIIFIAFSFFLNYHTLVPHIHENEIYLYETISPIVPIILDYDLDTIEKSLSEQKNTVLAVGDFIFTELQAREITHLPNVEFHDLQNRFYLELGGHLTRQETDAIMTELNTALYDIDLIVISISNNTNLSKMPLYVHTKKRLNTTHSIISTTKFKNATVYVYHSDN